MEVKDVMNLPWRKVTDWSDLSASAELFSGKFYVCKTDVNVFVERLYRNVARQLSIPYGNLLPILIAENGPFYTLKDLIFSDDHAYSKDDSKLIDLESTLRIPDTSKFNNNVATDNVSACLKMFEGLSDVEKILFLEKIGRISVKIEHCKIAEEVTDVTAD